MSAFLLPPTILLQHKDAINTALTTRYLCLAGVVILLCDIFTSHGTERRLVWTLPNSVGKWAFLINRYLVPACLAAGFFPLSGFIGLEFSDVACKSMAMIISCIGILSMGVANGLVVLRVVSLWDYAPRIVAVMVGSFICVTVASVATLMVALGAHSRVVWTPLLNMCTITKTSGIAVIAWAAPMAFEILVLGAVLWNALDKPRTTKMTLTRTLRRDGFMYFALIAVLRGIQTAFIATRIPQYFLLTNTIIWALVTVITNRALLALRRAEAEHLSDRIAVLGDRAQMQSPFALHMRPVGDRAYDADRKSSGPIAGRTSPLELIRVVEVERAHR